MTEEKHDPETGELPPKAEVIERAADGGPAPYMARSMGAFIDMLERGQFSADAMNSLKALMAGMRDLHDRTNKAQKGSITLKISLKSDTDAFFIEAEAKVTAPKEPRPRTMAWTDPETGLPTPSQPRQRVFFGNQDMPEFGHREIRQLS